MTKLQEFFWNTYKAYMLPLANDCIIPGALLETQWHWTLPLPWDIDTHPDFRRFEGMAWEVLSISGKPFSSRLHQAGILAGQLQDRFDFTASVPLQQFGLDFQLSAGEPVRSQLEVGDVRVRLFDDVFNSTYQLRRQLRELKEKDVHRYAAIDNDYMVTDAYYLEGLTWKFTRDGAAKLKAEMDKAEVDLSVNAAVDWKSDEVLHFSGVAKVPAAVRGIKI